METWSTLLTLNSLQQRLREPSVKSCFSNNCSEKFDKVLGEYVWGISKQFKRLLRTSLVTCKALYCKVLISCRDTTYVSICKWYFKLSILKTLLTNVLTCLFACLLTYLLAFLPWLLNARSQYLLLSTNYLTSSWSELFLGIIILLEIEFTVIGRRKSKGEDEFYSRWNTLSLFGKSK